MKALYGAIEAGGTKFICAVGSHPEDLVLTKIATTSPEATLKQAEDFFNNYRAQLKAIGIGSFGPVDLDPNSATYGHITTTPKPGWANTDILGYFKRAFKLPIGFDTDVNAAVLGEHMWGQARDLENAIYLTIGTGIGGGVLSHGQLIHGLMHPEMGHIMLPKAKHDEFTGTCPFHADRCLEGLACGPAIEARWGQAAETLSEDHPAWDLQADYIAKALVSFICTLSPQRIILGGGTMQQSHLLEQIRQQTSKHLNGYLHHPVLENLSEFIVSPGLGTRSGILGALALAMQSART